jgi:hypothetical protein
MRDFETKERVDSIEDEVLDSAEFTEWMSKTFKEEIFKRAAGRAGYDAGRHTLPSARERPGLYANTAEADYQEGEEPRSGYVNGASPRP